MVAGVDFENAKLADNTSASALACDKSCADLGFECGSQFDACGKPKDCGTCPDGRGCEGGKCSCVKKACAELGVACGTAPDGCGGAADCGKCANPSEACVDGKCKCQPKSCTQQGAECGNVPDGCGGQYTCGTCSDPTPFCGGSGANKCGATACAPKTCAQQGKNCGTISDGCGTILDCGQCPGGPPECGAGGVANVCGCTPTTCALQGKNCGSVPDGCGGTLNCGACTTPQTCQGGGVANVCGCTATSYCDECCGTGTNNCGQPCTRSTCCGGGGCFAAGTMVRLADGTSKPIEQIRAGEMVASYDRVTKTMVAARVVAAVVHGPETSAAGFVTVYGPEGAFRVTPNHPLVIDGVEQQAAKFREGSRITTFGSLRNTPASLAAGILDVTVRTNTVSRVDLVPGNNENTYDLKVEGSGTFFAGGVLALQKRIP